MIGYTTLHIEISHVKILKNPYDKTPLCEIHYYNYANLNKFFYLVLTLPLSHHLLTPYLFHLKNSSVFLLKHVQLFQKILLYQYCSLLSLTFQYYPAGILSYLYSYI